MSRSCFAENSAHYGDMRRHVTDTDHRALAVRRFRVGTNESCASSLRDDAQPHTLAPPTGCSTEIYAAALLPNFVAISSRRLTVSRNSRAITCATSACM